MIRLSPSRIELFTRCPARWGYSELLGRPEPDTPATDFGTSVHAIHEHRYAGIAIPDDAAGFVARAMLEHLPPVLPPGGHTEYEISVPLDGTSESLTGRLDLVYPELDYVVVRDYKTTSSLRWAKLDRAQLLGHAQAPFYAYAAMREYKVQTARLGWVYATTRNVLGRTSGWQTETARSDHTITYDEASERVHLQMVPTARQMIALRDEHASGRAVNTFPKNTSDCNSFGRQCPHFAVCRPDENRRQQMSFLEALKAQEEKVTTAVVESLKVVDDPVAVNPPEQALPAPVAAPTPEQPAPKRRGRPRKFASEVSTNTVPAESLIDLDDLPSGENEDCDTLMLRALRSGMRAALAELDKWNDGK